MMQEKEGEEAAVISGRVGEEAEIQVGLVSVKAMDAIDFMPELRLGRRSELAGSPRELQGRQGRSGRPGRLGRLGRSWPRPAPA